MIATIEFDNERRVVAQEVADVPTDGLLSAELRVNVAPNVIPQECFFIGQVLPKLFRPSFSKRMSRKPRHVFNMP